MTPFEKATENELDEMITLLDTYGFALSTIESILAWARGEKSQDISAGAILMAMQITGSGGLDGR